MPDLLAFVDWRPGFSVEEQRAQALAHGVPKSKIYEIGKDGVEHVWHFVQALRKGSVACVAGLHVLARNMTELDAVAQEIAKKGATIRDWNIPEPHAAFLAARRRFQGIARIPNAKEAMRRGRKGGKARWEGKALPKLSEEHERIWRDTEKYRTNPDAAMAIAKKLRLEVEDVKKLVAAIRYQLGPSGRAAGWPKPAAKKRKR